MRFAITPLLILISLFVQAQEGDTTVSLNARARVEFVSKSAVWTHMPESKCLSFDYPSPFIIVVTSKCDETQKVTLKRTPVNLLEGEPLLDVERPKKQ